MQLEGKRIIVTGGASGIAAATVLAYAREGAAVISLDIDDAAGSAVVEEAAGIGLGPIGYRHCDISREDEVAGVFDEAISRLGGLDALANIAGIEQQVPAEDVTEEDLDLMMAVHLKGTVFTNQAAFRSMRDAGGSIINYSSFAGVRGFPGMPAYGAAKAAVLGWTRIVAQDWGTHRIRVNAVCPAVLAG
jgi:NAD(P)-dependent dehydrogenase (short-subunit alcohol dehydrogenase family)